MSPSDLTRVRLVGTFLTFLGLLVSPAPGQATDVLNPYSVFSPSGTVELRIVPSEVRGVGPCRATLLRDGAEVWSRELDTTVWYAAVTDEGRVIAGAYRYGAFGWPHFNENDEENVLTALVLDPFGKELSRDDVPRAIRVMHSSADPSIVGAIAIPMDDVGVLSTSEGFGGPDLWRRYRLSTGEALARVIPDPLDAEGEGRRSHVDARPIPGTSLVLQVWGRTHWDGQTSTEAVRLAVLNSGGNAVWHRNFEEEYAGLDDDPSWWELSGLTKEQVELDEAGFAFRSLRDDRMIRFACREDGGRWSVVESGLSDGAGLAQHPLVKGRALGPFADLATLPLEVLETVDVVKSVDLERASVGGGDFHFDPEGLIGIVDKSDGAYVLRLFDADGRVHRTHPLAFVDSKYGVSLRPCRDGSWLVVSDWMDRGRVWRLNGETGESSLMIEMPEDRSVKAIVPIPDGGFVAIVVERSEYTMTDYLVCVGPDGAEAWSAELFSPEDVAMAGDEMIVVVDNIRDELQPFALDGTPRDPIALADVLGHEPNYPSGLESDGRGGLWLNDFMSRPPFHHLGPDFTLLSSIDPSLPNGHRFGDPGAIRTAPDGSIWATDNRRIMRLNDAGVVDHIIGPDPDNAPLTSFRSRGVGPDGRIYALSHTTGIVHVFSPDGEEFGQRRADPKYKYENVHEIHVAHDHSVMLVFRGGSIILIEPDGVSHEIIEGRLDEVAERYVPNRHAPGGWAIGYETIAKIGPDGEIVRRVEKKPDGAWFERPSAAAVAPDGTLAVLATTAMRRTDPHTPASSSLSLFGADGEPLRTLPSVGGLIWGPSQMVFDPPWIVIAKGPRLLVQDTWPGGETRVIPMPQQEGLQDYWWIFATPETHQIIANRAGATEFLRIRLPDP